MLRRFFKTHQDNQQRADNELAELERMLGSLDDALDELEKDQDELPLQLEQLKLQIDSQSESMQSLSARVDDLSLRVKDLEQLKANFSRWQLHYRELVFAETDLPKLQSRMSVLGGEVHKLCDSLSLLNTRDEQLGHLNAAMTAWEKEQRETFEALSKEVAELPSQADIAALRATIKACEETQGEHLSQLEHQFSLDGKALQARLEQLIKDITSLRQKITENFKDITTRMPSHQHNHYGGNFVCAWRPNGDPTWGGGNVCYNEMNAKSKVTGNPVQQAQFPSLDFEGTLRSVR